MVRGRVEQRRLVGIEIQFDHLLHAGGPEHARHADEEATDAVRAVAVRPLPAVKAREFPPRKL